MVLFWSVNNHEYWVLFSTSGWVKTSSLYESYPLYILKDSSLFALSFVVRMSVTSIRSTGSGGIIVGRIISICLSGLAFLIASDRV